MPNAIASWSAGTHRDLLRTNSGILDESFRIPIFHVHLLKLISISNLGACGAARASDECGLNRFPSRRGLNDRDADTSPMSQAYTFIPDRFRAGLAELLTAFDYAQDSQTDPWQFAMGLADVLSVGATLADVRWLVLRGYAEHARETTVPGDLQRTFRGLAPTSFPSDLHLTLTAVGAAKIRSLLAGTTAPPQLANVEPVADATSPFCRVAPACLKPVWDAAHRELRYNGRLVKRFRVPALNQIAVLDAFQEDGWPEFIDDPIPPEHGIDPKQRLNVTIKSLNRNQLEPLIRFHGNGNGLQVYWEVVEAGS